MEEDAFGTVWDVEAVAELDDSNDAGDLEGLVDGKVDAAWNVELEKMIRPGTMFVKGESEEVDVIKEEDEIAELEPELEID